MRLSGGRIVRRLNADETGTTAVEFGIVALPFFAILFGIIETGMVFLAGLVLDNATTQASREIFTGQVQTQNLTKEQFKEKLCANVPALLDCANGVMIDVQSSLTEIPKLTPPKDADGNLTATGDTWDPGVKNSYVVVRALYQYPILISGIGPIDFHLDDLAGGKRLLVSTIVFRNEPYAAPSQAQ
ncbi:MAG: pilus assembly protein [Methylacidiphilales bacterium]|nr:pilus assembly protein [Candidatus Methylacidiphilales bacterium]